MTGLILAYGFIWAAVCGYVFLVQKGQRRLEREVETLKGKLLR